MPMPARGCRPVQSPGNNLLRRYHIIKGYHVCSLLTGLTQSASFGWFGGTQSLQDSLFSGSGRAAALPEPEKEGYLGRQSLPKPHHCVSPVIDRASAVSVFSLRQHGTFLFSSFSIFAL